MRKSKSKKSFSYKGQFDSDNSSENYETPSKSNRGPKALSDLWTRVIKFDSYESKNPSIFQISEDLERMEEDLDNDMEFEESK